MRYVLSLPLKEPDNNEGKIKVLKMPTVKDRPDDDSPKIAKYAKLSFSFKKPIAGGQAYVCPGFIKPSLGDKHRNMCLRINKTNDLVINLTPENVTQHSRIE